jgi:hypothetical protein
MMRAYVMASVAGALVAGVLASSADARVRQPPQYQNNTGYSINEERGIGDRQEGNRYYRSTYRHHHRHHYH